MGLTLSEKELEKLFGAETKKSSVLEEAELNTLFEVEKPTTSPTTTRQVPSPTVGRLPLENVLGMDILSPQIRAGVASFAEGVVPFLKDLPIPGIERSLEESKAAFPKTSLVGQLAGSVVPIGASFKAATLATRAARPVATSLAKRIAPQILRDTRAARILRASGQAISVGAITDVLFNALRGETPNARDAAIFAAIDAVVPVGSRFLKIRSALKKVRAGEELTGQELKVLSQDTSKNIRKEVQQTLGVKKDIEAAVRTFDTPIEAAQSAKKVSRATATEKVTATTDIRPPIDVDKFKDEIEFATNLLGDVGGDISKANISRFTLSMERRFGDQIRENVEDIFQLAQKDFAANIRLAKFPQQGQEAIKQASREVGINAIEEQRRGIMTWKTIDELTLEELNTIGRARRGEIKPGTSLNAEQMNAVIQDTGYLARAVDLDPGIIKDPVFKGQFLNTMKSLIGARAEAGRTLQQLRRFSDPDFAESILRVKGLSEDEQIKASLAMFEKAVRENTAVPIKAFRMLVELSINMKLASPSSVIRSVLGNTMRALTEYVEQPIRVGADMILNGLFSKAKGRERYLSELKPTMRFMGGVDAFKEANRNFIGVFAENEEVLAKALFLRREQFFNREIPNFTFKGIKLPLGKVIRAPGNAQGAIDIFFRTYLGRFEANALAIRKSVQRDPKIRGEALMEEFVKLRNDPAIIKEAALNAERFTFQQELGPVGQKINDLRRQVPASKFIVPFFNTWVNIGKFIFERTPLEILSAFRGNSPLRAAMREFSTTGKTGPLADKLAAMTSGTAFLATSYAIANTILDGRISGNGPLDANARRLLEQSGWRRDSIKINTRQGPTWVSYRGYEPLSAFMSMTANYNEGRRDGGKVKGITQAAIGTARMFRDNPFMLGAAKLNEFFGFGAQGKITEFFATLGAGIVIPTMVQQTARVVDPTFRTVKDPDFMTELQNRIAVKLPAGMRQYFFLPERLPARLNIFGKELKRDMSWGRYLALYVDNVETDPVGQALSKAGLLFKSTSFRYDNTNLTIDQANQLVTIAGPMFYAAMKAHLKNPTFQQMLDENPDLAADVIRSTKEAIFDAQKHVIFGAQR